MKETVIDVLMFLFDNYLYIDQSIPMDERSLSFELQEAGFETPEITKAFDWLDKLAWMKQVDAIHSQTTNALRVFSPEEMHKLDAACRGFLLDLEQMGIITVLTREILIERVMAIEGEQLSLKQFKGIAGLILLAEVENEEMLLKLEEFIYDDIEKVFH